MPTDPEPGPDLTKTPGGHPLPPVPGAYPPPGYVQPGPGYAPAPGAAVPAKPDSYLVWGILATVLCCMPLGIVSIVKAAKVDALWASGRYDEARAASTAAKRWAVWSAFAYVVLVALWVAFWVGLMLLAPDTHAHPSFTPTSQL